MRNKTYPRMHVSLYVSDVKETENFYSSFFGINPVKKKDDYVKYILENPSLIISFIENKEKVKDNFGHLGFEVATESEMRLRLELAKVKGLEVKEEIGTSCCYAVQDKFWVSDPDGVQWEVYYFHEDSEFNDPKYAGEDSSACCMPQTKVEKKKIELAEITEQACEPGSGCC
jgi:catechol 2,3-dioxygenase-like lactoylglutathione lyase family enzyme